MTKAIGIKAIIEDAEFYKQNEVYFSFGNDPYYDLDDPSDDPEDMMDGYGVHDDDIFFYVEDENAFLEIKELYTVKDGINFLSYEIVYAEE